MCWLAEAVAVGNGGPSSNCVDHSGRLARTAAPLRMTQSRCMFVPRSYVVFEEEAAVDKALALNMTEV